MNNIIFRVNKFDFQYGVSAPCRRYAEPKSNAFALNYLALTFGFVFGMNIVDCFLV